MSQGIEECFVLAALFEVLQTGFPAQSAIGNVENVNGFAIRYVELEEAQVFIDPCDEYQNL